MIKTALIAGVSGQDGQYTAKLLLDMGYKVIGTTRSISNAREFLPEYLSKEVNLYEWDLINETQLRKILEKNCIDEIYNFAARSSGEKMFEDPVGVSVINGLAVTKILSAINEINPKIRFAQASSSEMFGKVQVIPQTEIGPFSPISPYGAAKLYAHNMINVYREFHGLFACSAILFNHESPIRGLNFVTRKISHTAAKIKLGHATELVLGNLDISRDWMFSGDAVRAMWMMLQNKTADDYVVASGISHTVRQFCEIAFNSLGLNYQDYVKTSPDFYRKINSVSLQGDTRKLSELGWTPQVDFENLVRQMVENDVKLLTT
jgi:GDPmannose 4,6-dehydratase